MMIDGQTSRPFIANSSSSNIQNQNRQKVIDVSAPAGPQKFKHIEFGQFKII